MNNRKFVTIANDIYENVNNKYCLGMWGNPITDSRIASKATQYPEFYTGTKIAELRKLVGKSFYGFDCVCYIKAILWGMRYESKYGTIIHPSYGSNGVPDFGADSAKKYCTTWSTDFHNIEVGEILWISGHVGIYIGNGEALECTNAWEQKIQKTNVNSLSKANKHSRTWTAHGRLKFIEYEGDSMTRAEVEQMIDDTLKGITLEIANINAKLFVASKRYHYFSELPDYAQKPIGTLFANGYLAGRSVGDLD